MPATYSAFVNDGRVNIMAVVATTSNAKSMVAFLRLINPSEMGLLPKTRQYLVSLSICVSFLSMSPSTMSLRMSPASKPKSPMNMAWMTVVHEKPP